jgi:nitrite reductase/ring-hydroxylating ferredoxin subunit
MMLRSGNDVKVYVNRCAHFGVQLATRQELLIFDPHSNHPPAKPEAFKL